MNLACRLPAVLGVILSAGSLCYGATVTGTVKSPDGQPFAGAFVQAQNTRTRITTIAVSDSQGRYRAEGLQAGDYRVQIRAMGYRADPQTGVHLTDSRNAPLDFALQKSAVRWNNCRSIKPGSFSPRQPEKDLVPELFYLPRISNAHGLGYARRRRLERPRRVHAHRHEATH